MKYSSWLVMAVLYVGTPSSLYEMLQLIDKCMASTECDQVQTNATISHFNLTNPGGHHLPPVNLRGTQN